MSTYTIEVKNEKGEVINVQTVLITSQEATDEEIEDLREDDDAASWILHPEHPWKEWTSGMHEDIIDAIAFDHHEYNR